MASFLASIGPSVGIAAAQAKPSDSAAAVERVADSGFDVVSIKPHKAGDAATLTRWSDTTYTAENISLANLISAAYNVKTWLVFGLPPWAEKARWDIQAKNMQAGEDQKRSLSSADVQARLAGLLRDRFGFAAHTERKTQPVYQMTVLPGGPKLHESAPLPPTSAGEKPAATGGWSVGNGMMKANRMSMQTLADNLAYQVERVIVDGTNLPGVYDFELHWTPEDRAGGDNGVAGDTPPAIFTAMREQLGLRLSSANAPVPSVVVDEIKPPEED